MNAWRHYAVVLLFLTACCGLAVRVVYLAVSEKQFLQEQGDARSVRSEVIPSYRGVVYDRLGEPLAVSTPVVAVWTDPTSVRLSNTDIARLAPSLDLSPKSLARLLTDNAEKSFVYLKRQVSWTAAEKIRGLEIEGLYFHGAYHRYYPAAETTAHLVGVTDVDDVGLEGVELAFDHLLKGQHGQKVVLKDRLGNTIRDLNYVRAPRFGKDLNLSVDLRLQYFAHRELKAAVEHHSATSGSLVMLDVDTGEILALVNAPSYNPNEPLKPGYAGMRNRAVTDTYEPGSTVKPFTVLAALESGRYQPGTQIDTAPGYFRVGNKLVQDPVNLGSISLAEALQKSSQVGITKVALQLDKRAVFDVLLRAGVGQYIGTGLPGESLGSISEAGLDNPVIRATLAYGYGLTLSPLQLAQAYLVIANGGVRMPLSAIKIHEPPKGERVYNQRDVQDVLAMMERVTTLGGTAPRASVAGYRVAGKTGTVRVVVETGYSDELHVALFAGIVPVSDPRIVMVVVVNEPTRGGIGGGVVAAPVFSRVAERALRLLGVEPDAARSERVRSI
ncbi:MAG: penicillin-binding protein 2 [Gammaproteobacteria bacterium]|nr:penicillin-binding protein 2 [Gammaproteobacteria bacterium]